MNTGNSHLDSEKYSLNLLDIDNIDADYELADIDCIINTQSNPDSNFIDNDYVLKLIKLEECKGKLKASFNNAIAKKINIEQVYKKSDNAEHFFRNILNDIKDIILNDNDIAKNLDEFENIKQ